MNSAQNIVQASPPGAAAHYNSAAVQASHTGVPQQAVASLPSQQQHSQQASHTFQTVQQQQQPNQWGTGSQQFGSLQPTQSQQGLAALQVSRPLQTASQQQHIAGGVAAGDFYGRAGSITPPLPQPSSQQSGFPGPGRPHQPQPSLPSQMQQQQAGGFPLPKPHTPPPATGQVQQIQPPLRVAPAPSSTPINPNPMYPSGLQARPSLTPSTARHAHGQAPRIPSSNFPPGPQKPHDNTVSDNRLLSKRGIALAMRSAGLDKTVFLDADAEAYLTEFYEELVSSALNLGCEVAKRRGAPVPAMRDLRTYVERQWDIRVPGLEDTMRTYRRPRIGDAEHMERQQCIKDMIEKTMPPAS